MNKGSIPSFYLVPPEGPIIQEWEAYFKKRDVKAASWQLEVELTAVIQQQEQPTYNMLCALQHYLQLIAELVFSLEIKFKRPDKDDEMVFTHSEVEKLRKVKEYIDNNLERTLTIALLARVIARWYGIELVIDDPVLNNRQFTGVIDRNKPVRVFLDNMKAANGLNYYIQGETIHIK